MALASAIMLGDLLKKKLHIHAVGRAVGKCATNDMLNSTELTRQLVTVIIYHNGKENHQQDVWDK